MIDYSFNIKKMLIALNFKYNSMLKKIYFTTCSEKWSRFELPRDKTNKLTCGQQRLRSAWASAQSDQSLCCLLEES